MAGMDATLDVNTHQCGQPPCVGFYRLGHELSSLWAAHTVCSTAQTGQARARWEGAEVFCEDVRQL